MWVKFLAFTHVLTNVGLATSASLSSTSTTQTSTATATTPAATQFSTPAPSSKAWIAGPVIGAVALIAAIAFALWFIRHKRRERAITGQSRQDGYVSYDAVPQHVEMTNTGYVKAELPSQPVERAELGSDTTYRQNELPGWRSVNG